MKRLFVILTALVAVAFLGAVAVAITPELSRDDSIHLTPRAQSWEAGTYTVVERDMDLPRPNQIDYVSFEVPGAVRHRMMDGLVPRGWVGFAPAGADDGPRPLVILFPGAARSPMSMIDMWQDVAREHGLILVAMEGLRNTDAAQDPDPGRIMSLLAAARETYPVDPERVFLFGHSTGAAQAQVVANRVAGPWRGVAGHAGHPAPSWLHPITGAPPVRLYLGTSDNTFLPARARIFAETMAQAGHDYELILIPGHTHWFYAAGPVIAADAWAWFETL